MKESEFKVLQALETNDGSRASTIGGEVYGGERQRRGGMARKPQAYARPAAKMLYRLEALGFAVRHAERWGTFWRITVKGRDALAHEKYLTLKPLLENP